MVRVWRKYSLFFTVQASQSRIHALSSTEKALASSESRAGIMSTTLFQPPVPMDERKEYR